MYIHTTGLLFFHENSTGRTFYLTQLPAAQFFSKIKLGQVENSVDQIFSVLLHQKDNPNIYLSVFLVYYMLHFICMCSMPYVPVRMYSHVLQRKKLCMYIQIQSKYEINLMLFRMVDLVFLVVESYMLKMEVEYTRSVSVYHSSSFSCT